MSREQLIYMDFAATSAIRPPEVTRAVTDFLGNCGATPGRGGHRLAIDAGRIALRCRMALAKLLDFPGDPGRVAFMLNATHAINTAMWGVLGEGDIVVVSAYDHNAVLRTAHRLSHERGVKVRMITGAPDGSVDLDEVDRLLEGARLLVVNAVSNVLGTSMPVAALTQRAHRAGALVLVDAAQSAGHQHSSAKKDEVDLIAFTGHKGLLGIQGVGGLWVRDGIDVKPLLTGGTGGDSTLRDMPPSYPDHLEAGTGCAAGIASVLAGIEWIQKRSLAAIHEQSAALKTRLWDGLSAIADVRVLSPRDPDGAALVTILPRHLDVPTLANRLDREHGVLTRAGLHCAPEAHRLLGSDQHGAVRFSLGWSSTEEEVDQAVAAVAQITSAGKVFSLAPSEAPSC